MGLGFIDPTRLLQKTWQSASELAMELFHQATQAEPARVGRPVELSKPAGRPALKIDYAPIPREQASPAPPRIPKQEQFAESGFVSSRTITPTADIPGPAPVSVDSLLVARSAAEAVRQAAAPIFRETEQLFLKDAVEAPLSRLATRVIASSLEGLRPPASPQLPARTPQQPKRHSEQQFPAGQFVTSKDVEKLDIASRSQSAARVSGKPEATPYSPKGSSYAHNRPGGLGDLGHPDPAVDVAGPVAFRGPDPVQFESMPQVFDRRSGGYINLDSTVALQSGFHRWLTINAKVCWCDDTGVSAAVLRQPPSVSDLGSGTVTMYQVDQDANQLQPIDDPGSEEGSETRAKIYSLYAFPFKNTFALASMLGDHWFIFPFGSCVPFTTRDGGIPAGQSATCDLYSATGGGLVAAGEAGVINDFGTTLGAEEGTKGLAVIDTGGNLRAVAEDC